PGPCRTDLHPARAAPDPPPVGRRAAHDQHDRAPGHGGRVRRRPPDRGEALGPPGVRRDRRRAAARPAPGLPGRRPRDGRRGGLSRGDRDRRRAAVAAPRAGAAARGAAHLGQRDTRRRTAGAARAAGPRAGAERAARRRDRRCPARGRPPRHRARGGAPARRAGHRRERARGVERRLRGAERRPARTARARGRERVHRRGSAAWPRAPPRLLQRHPAARTRPACDTRAQPVRRVRRALRGGGESLQRGGDARGRRRARRRRPDLPRSRLVRARACLLAGLRRHRRRDARAVARHPAPAGAPPPGGYLRRPGPQRTAAPELARVPSAAPAAEPARVAQIPAAPVPSASAPTNAPSTPVAAEAAPPAAAVAAASTPVAAVAPTPPPPGTAAAPSAPAPEAPLPPVEGAAAKPAAPTQAPRQPAVAAVEPRREPIDEGRSAPRLPTVRLSFLVYSPS